MVCLQTFRFDVVFLQTLWCVSRHSDLTWCVSGHSDLTWRVSTACLLHRHVCDRPHTVCVGTPAKSCAFHVHAARLSICRRAVLCRAAPCRAAPRRLCWRCRCSTRLCQVACVSLAPPAGNDGRSEGQRESESGAERVKRERRVDVTFVLDAGTDKDRKTVHAGTDKAVRYLYMPVRTRAGRYLYMPVRTRAGRYLYMPVRTRQ